MPSQMRRSLCHPSIPALLACACVGAGAGAQLGTAGTSTWDGEAGDFLWFSGDNWDPNGVPGEFWDVTIDADQPVTVNNSGNELIELGNADISSGLIMRDSYMHITGDADITDLEINTPLTMQFFIEGSLDINGNSIFLQIANFDGGGDITLNDDLAADFAFDVDEFTTVNVAGNVTSASGNIDLDQFANLNITGALTLLGGSISTIAQSDPMELPGRLNINGGTVSRVGGVNDTNLSAHTYMASGTIKADAAGLNITQNYDITGGTLSATNGGTLEVRVFTGSQFNVCNPDRFEGDGTVIINAPIFVGSDGGAITNTIQAPGSLQFRNTAGLDAPLDSPGVLSLRGTTLTGNGNIRVSGTLEVPITSTLGVQTILEAGGEMRLQGNEVRLQDAEFRINSGAAATLAPGAFRDVLGDGSGFVQINGRLLFEDRPGINDTSAIEAPVNNGGEVRVTDTRVFFRKGGTWSGGEFNLEGDTPQLVIDGTSAIEYIVDAPTTFSANVDDAEVLIGSANSNDPSIEMNADLVFDVKGEGSYAETRLLIMGKDIDAGGSFPTVFNTGNMRITSLLSLDANLDNSGSLLILGGLGIEGTTINSGFLEQRANFNDRDDESAGDEDRITNSGTWLVTASCNIGEVDELQEGVRFVNSGTLEARGNLTLNIYEQLVNPGLLLANSATINIAFPGFTIEDELDEDGDTQIVVDGGNFVAQNGGRILFPRGGEPNIMSNPGTTVDGNGFDQPWIEGIKRVRQGATLNTTGDTDFENSLSLEGEGTTVSVAADAEVSAPDVSVSGGAKVELGQGSTLSSPGTIESEPPMAPSLIDDLEGVISLARGAGTTMPPTVRAPLVAWRGAIAPAADGEGELLIDGDLALFDSSRLRISLNGPASDLLTVTGAASVDGVVELSLADGFLPGAGDSYAILAAGQPITGAFDGVIAPDLPIEASIRIVGTQAFLDIGEACAGDVNGDTAITIADVLFIISRFGDTEPHSPADANADGSVTIADVLFVIARFGEPCPS